jgi:PAS domain S-box-containing protein
MAKVIRDWAPIVAIALPASAVAALGAFVLAGWLGGRPQWLVPLGSWAAMVAATAFGLMIAGAGVLSALVPTPTGRALRLAAGTALVVLGAAALAQYAFAIDLGIDFPEWHRGIDALNAYPGRMSPASAVAMVSCGILLFAFDRPATRFSALLVQLLAGVLLAIGVASLVAHDVTPEGIFPWYRYSHMAPATAGAVILLGVAFLALIARSPWYQAVYARRADERILILVIGIFTLVLTGVGAAALAILQKHMEGTVSAALANAVENRIVILENVFASRVTRASLVASRPTVRKLLEEWDGDGSERLRGRLREEAASYLGAGFRGVGFYDEHNRPLVEVGALASEPTLDVPVLGQRAQASLLWDNEAFLLRVFSPVYQGTTWVGSVLTEQELELLPKLHLDVDKLGESAQWVMCAALGEAMGCFAQRFSRYPRVIARAHDARAVPMDYALDGRRGFVTTTDIRGKRVIAAFGPVGRTGLGVVIELSAEEFYAPLRQQLAQWGQWFFAMALLGALLVSSQVRPVARRLVESEEVARRRAEALARSEAGMRAIYASLVDGIIVLSPQGVIEFLNPAAERLFGYPPGSLVGQSVGVLIPDGLRQANERATRRFVESGDSGVVGQKGLVYPALRRDGSRVEVEFSLAEMRSESGVRLVGVVRDVSERSALERMKSEFVAAVSHELRTPLTSIIGSLELAAEGELPDAGREFVEMARRNSVRLAALVNDVMDAARLDSGALSFEASRFDAAALAAEAVELNQSYAATRRVTLRLEEPCATAEIDADRGRLMQVMENLLSNAAKFSPEGGEVRVRVLRVGARVRFEVGDQGRGIPEEFKARVFERFAQADASDSREKGGTGLGLAIAKGLVERMGGAIGFDARAGGGTTFWFEMPAAAGGETR